MEKDQRNHDYDPDAQDIPRRLAAFWGNQLQQIKRRAEGEANGTSTRLTSDSKFRLEPGSNNGH